MKGKNAKMRCAASSPPQLHGSLALLLPMGAEKSSRLVPTDVYALSLLETSFREKFCSADGHLYRLFT